MKEFRQTLAVVDDQAVYTCGRRWAHSGFDDIAGLATLAEHYGLTHVWAVVGTQVSRLGQGAFADTQDVSDAWSVAAIGKDAYGYLSVRRVEKRHEDHIEIGFPEWSRWPWKQSSNTASGLLRTLIHLEELLGFPVAYTPAWCALELFKRLNAERWDWLEPMTLDLESKGFNYAEDIARELHWPPKGQQVPLPAGATHLVRVDTNSAYNAAETGLRVGQGNPVWWEGQEDYIYNGAGAYDGKHPGIWRVDVSGECAWDGKRLPGFHDRKWLTTDMIEQLRRSGLTVLVDGGWHWSWKDEKHQMPAYHQTLRSFAETLWEQRQKWRPLAEHGGVAESVYDSIRVMLKALHGKLGAHGNDLRFRRRDIWALVVARSVAMSIYKIEKIHQKYGIWPIRIKADEFTYAVSDVHIFDEMLSTGTLGGLKLVSIEEIERTQD